MAYNIMTIDEDQISFGPGKIYLGAAGATPSTEVGAVDAGMTLTISRTMMDLSQGSPKQLVKRVCTEEKVEIEFTGLQWNLANLQKALGGGEYDSDSDGETLAGGGDMEMTEYALRFVHQTAAGGTITVDLWNVVGSGESAVQMGDEWHKFPMKFSAQNSDTDWASASLDAKKRMYKIRKDNAPA